MKIFYYFGKDYKDKYERLSKWLNVYFTLSGCPYFNFRGKRYKLDNFYRTESEVTTADKKESVTLSGYEIDVYYKPYFIELSNYGEKVRIYQFQGVENER